MTVDAGENTFGAHSVLSFMYVHERNGRPLAKIITAEGKGATNLTWDRTEPRMLFMTKSESGHVLAVKWYFPGLLGGV